MTTTRKPKTPSGKGRKLRLKKETLKELDARRGAGRVKGGGVTAAVGVICGPTDGCATAAYTNCKLSCVAACGGGLKIG